MLRRYVNLISFIITFGSVTANAASQIDRPYKWVLLNSRPRPLTTFSVQKGKVYPGGVVDPEPIKVADLRTFKVAVKSGDQRANFWAKDKNHIYFGDELLVDADPATFVVLSEQVAKDKRHVYCWNFNEGGFSGELNKIGDPNTFKMMTSPGDQPTSQFWYYRDAIHVFSKWCTLVQGVDVDSFEMVPNPMVGFDAKDKNRKYSLGKAAD